MRSSYKGFSLSNAAALLAFSSLASAVTFDCNHVRVDGQSFDFSELGGAYAVHMIEDTPPSISNTTFTVNICTALGRTKNVPKVEECPGGTRICAIKTNYNAATNIEEVTEVRPIAGDYAYSHGRSLDPSLTRLKGSSSNSDTEREGVRVELNGGRFPFDKTSGVEQRAIIEFECNPERTGLEGLEKGSGGKPQEDKKKDDEEAEERLRTREEGEKKEGDDKAKPEDTSSLTLISYKQEGEGDKTTGVLRLNWKTKYACEGQTEHSPAKSTSGHWGWFTWLFIM